ncbi:MAG: M1 family metallopeptidase [Cyanobacteria bacterium P01_H01_bin.15]
MSFYFDAEETRRPFELPGAKPHYTPDRPGQVDHIFLDLALDFETHSFRGSCTTTLTPIRTGIQQFSLDAVDLNIAGVFVGDVSQPFDYDGEILTVNLLRPTTLEPFQLEIQYSVEQPQRGLYFIAPDEHYPEKPVQAWTQGEDEDSRFWFPCFDYPGQLATSEIRVDVPANLTAVSNGELISTEDVPGGEIGDRKIFHWQQTQVHPTYLMTLAVGEFAETHVDWEGIPVSYYVEKSRADDAERSMGKTPRMMAFLSEQYGYRYAFPKYAQVCVADFIFGGMENTSTTLLTDRCLLDERAALDNTRTETLVLHELAHQWFGDLVVIKHWSHAWIKEGMASYAEVLWTEYEYGSDEGAYYILNEARSYLNEDSSRYRRPIVTHVYREAIELYDRHLYEKGACVYHMIRGILGDELFTKAIHTFVQDNAHQTVETVDLLRAIDKATGFNLLFLFDQYVFRGGHPDFKVGYAWDNDNSVAKLTVTQMQVTDDSKDVFDLKIPLHLNFEDEGVVSHSSFTIHLHQKEHVFYFPLPLKPSFVSFDAGNQFLKTVSLDYPLPELKAQLKFDSDSTSRIYAAIAIQKKGSVEAIKALGEALQTEAFWGVRAEVAKQLGKLKLSQAYDALTPGLQDENPKVRRATISALSNFKTPASLELLKKQLQQGDTSYYTESAIASVLGGMAAGSLRDSQAAILSVLKDVLATRSGWNEVVRAGAVAGIAQLTTYPDAVSAIIPYTDPGVPQALRLGAIRALGAVSTGQPPEQVTLILETLESLSGESFFLTQVAIASALSQMKSPEAIGLLQSLASQTPDGRVRRLAEEAVSKVQKKLGSDKAVSELRQQVEQLQQQNQDLLSRLTKVETLLQKENSDSDK